MPDSSTPARPSVRGSFVSTVLTLIGIAVIAVLVWIFLPATQAHPYAFYAVVALITWVSCPWLVRNLGKILFPLGILVLVWLALTGFGVDTPKIDFKLPTAESIQKLLPKVSWEKDQEDTGPLTGSESSSDSGSGDSGGTVETPPSRHAAGAAPVTPSHEVVVPTRRFTVRPEVDGKLAADPVTLAVFQKGAEFGSWMAYFIWVQSLDLDPVPNEWKGLRIGLQPSKAAESETEAKRAYLYALKGISIDKDGYPVGEDEEATVLIRKIFDAFQSIEK